MDWDIFLNYETIFRYSTTIKRFNNEEEKILQKIQKLKEFFISLD